MEHIICIPVLNGRWHNRLKHRLNPGSKLHILIKPMYQWKYSTMIYIWYMWEIKSARTNMSIRYKSCESTTVNSLRPSNPYVHQCDKPSLVEIMTCHYLNQCWNIVNSTLTNKLQWNINRFFSSRKCIWKCRLRNGGNCGLGLNVLI